MHKIALINMPFASLKFPSLALTQLESILVSTFTDKVSTEVFYLNHDFADYIGIKDYQRIAVDMEAPYNGFGDWFFRQAAFPELSDNTEVYFQRYFPHSNEQNQILKGLIQKKRDGLEQFMDNLIDQYNLSKVDIIGFTSMFSQNVACFAFARKIKEHNPNITVLMGGANCETPMGQEIVKNVASIDFVFSGTALKSLLCFVQNHLDGDINKLDQIKGVFSKSNHATKASDDVVGEELPLDVLIPLDYDPFLDALEKKFPDENIEPILFFETSRGCWWGERAHCTFCGLNGRTMNYRSMCPEKARNLIQSLFKYSSRVSRLLCVDNILPKNYPEEVFAELNTPDNITIFYEVKANLSEEELKILSRARVKEVQPGIEALATSTLKLMRKGTTAFQNLSFLKACVMSDVFPNWSLLVGSPGEGEDVYKKYITDIPMLIHLPPPSGVYPVRPDRFSPYQIQAEEYGLNLNPAEFYELVYPFSKESLGNLAYFFRDYNFAAEHFQAMVQWFGKLREKVEIWRGRWNCDEHLLQPMLYFKDLENFSIIYDSRGGNDQEHRISDAGGELLQCLTKPINISDLPSMLNHISNFDLDKEIETLKARGLIFQEKNRIMSLVLPEKPVLTLGLAQWSWAT